MAAVYVSFPMNLYIDKRKTDIFTRGELNIIFSIINLQ